MLSLNFVLPSLMTCRTSLLKHVLVVIFVNVSVCLCCGRAITQSGSEIGKCSRGCLEAHHVDRYAFQLITTFASFKLQSSIFIPEKVGCVARKLLNYTYL